ncbi:MAG: 30S ribosomal protein S6 [Syntrophobacterales bacterium]|jgi:small subunit ribosomal protein S6|nr:30S ribosomal protein S6 [Syntrophobacterales bacterium]
MRRYEIVFVVLSNIPDTEIDGVVERYQNMVTELKGSLIKVDRWGQRKLAYEIKKQNMGHYVLFDFAGGTSIVDELERNFKIDDKVLKFLSVKKADVITAEEIEQILAEQAAANQPAEKESDDQAPPNIAEETEQDAPSEGPASEASLKEEE